MIFFSNELRYFKSECIIFHLLQTAIGFYVFRLDNGMRASEKGAGEQDELNFS